MSRLRSRNRFVLPVGLLLATSGGCRVCLPPVDESNLWLRTVEDRCDGQLGQPACPPYSTHCRGAMDAREVGFRRGYAEESFVQNSFPPGQYRAVWSPTFRNRFCDENLVNEGYIAGREAALAEGLVGVARR